MSYSFSVRGDTKAVVVADMQAKFDRLVAAQPAHQRDAAAAMAAVTAFVAVLEDDDSQDVVAQVSGWLHSDVEADAFRVMATHVNVTALLKPRGC